MLKTKRFRRLLTVLLAVLMLSVSIPVAAFADDGKATVTFDFVADEDNHQLKQSQDVTIDAGKTFDDALVQVDTNIDSWQLKDKYIDTKGNPYNGSMKLGDGMQAKVILTYVRAEKPEEPKPETVNITVQLVDSETGENVGEMQDFDLLTGKDYTADDMVAYGLQIPAEYYVTDAEKTYAPVNWAVYTIEVAKRPTTVNITVQLVDSETGENVGEMQDFDIFTGKDYTADDMVAYGLQIPAEYYVTDAEKTYAPVDWAVYTIEVTKRPTAVNITVQLVDVETGENVGEMQDFDIFTGKDYTAAEMVPYGLQIPTNYVVVDADKTYAAVDWAVYTIEVKRATVMHNVTVQREGYDDVLVQVAEGADLKAALMNEEIMNQVLADLPEGTTVSDYTYADPEHSAITPVQVYGDLTVRAVLTVADPDQPTTPPTEDQPTTPPTEGGETTTPPTEGGDTTTDNNSGNNNTTTVTSNSNDKKDSGEEVVKSTAAPVDNTAKVLPQTGVQASAPIAAFVVVLAAALAGAACYLFVVRKKLN